LTSPPAKPVLAAKRLPDGYESRHSGPAYDVMIKTKVKKKMEKKASADQLAALQDLLERYGESGSEGFPRGKFNSSEQWFPSQKDKRVHLQAFKAGQLRAYGYCQQFNGRPTFFITGFDRSKKQDDADQNILSAAGAEAVRVFESLK
jgi:hypothetical protein